MLALLFGAVSLLYATVGQAGGTAFLAVMAFSSFAADEMRPTALLLNIVAATYSTWLFNRGKLVDWAKLRPLLLASLPTALLGGVIVLDERIYNAVNRFGADRRGTHSCAATLPRWGARSGDPTMGRNRNWCNCRLRVWPDRRRWWCLPRPYPDRSSLGLSKTDGGTFSTFHLG